MFYLKHMKLRSWLIYKHFLSSSLIGIHIMESTRTSLFREWFKKLISEFLKISKFDPIGNVQKEILLGAKIFSRNCISIENSNMDSLLWEMVSYKSVTHSRFLTINMVIQSECRVYPKRRHRAYFHCGFEFLLMSLVAVPYVQAWFSFYFPAKTLKLFRDH